ncbi:MAG: M3 family oligoendopeptidase, partial [Planctomycetota bacterium]|nr:M3 family oligoendopeptidase [Planctomycetota bacterium]
WTPNTWEDIKPLFAEFEERSLGSGKELEEWLLQLSEVDSLIGGVASRRYFASSCDTSDASAEEEHLDYQMKVLPEVAKVGDRLNRKYLNSPARSEMNPEHWLVHDRDAERAVELFREENVALVAQEEELGVEYGRISGGMTVEFEGKTCTLQEMSTHLESTDRNHRELVWRLVSERRLQEREAIDLLFDKMIALRVEMAENAGFENYRDYKHSAKHRFDYSPADCMALHESVSRTVMPALKKMQQRRKRLLGLEVMRPWDLAVDPEGLPPFQPFSTAEEQVQVASKIMAQVDSETAEDLKWMNAKGQLDLETRPSKRPGGYMDVFGDVRWPVIFSNSAPTHAGIQTLIHETGHARHALLARDLEPGDYREAPLEFAEVASMGMEAMCMENLDAAYPKKEARRAAIDSLEDMLASLAWTCTVDAFQHEIYLNPNYSHEERTACWENTWERFSAGSVDWSGLEETRATRWHSQLHIFEVPFYYIEYAIAQMGAMQLWSNYRKDKVKTISEYQRGLALGGSRPLPDLFSAAGLRFDPRGEGLEPLVHEVEEAWIRLTGDVE